MRNIFYLLLACLLAACVREKPHPISCDQITILRAQVGKETSPEQFRDWVSRTYQLPTETITIEAATAETAKYGTRSVVRWHTGNFQYVAQLGDRELRWLVVGGILAPADSLISCLGESAWYFVHSDDVESGVQRSVELFFPEQGAVLDGWYYVPSSARSHFPVNSDRLSWHLTFIKPGPLERLVNDYWDYDPMRARDALQKIKPWPGEWAKVDFAAPE